MRSSTRLSHPRSASGSYWQGWGLGTELLSCLAGCGPGTVEYEIALVPAEYSLDWWFGCVDGLVPTGS